MRSMFFIEWKENVALITWYSKYGIAYMLKDTNRYAYAVGHRRPNYQVPAIQKTED